MKFLCLICSVAAGLFGWGCSTAGTQSKTFSASAPISQPAESATVPLVELSSEKRAEALARFATGVTYELTDQSTLALEQFYRASQADPTNEDLALDLARRFLQLKQTGKAIQILENSAKQPAASGNLLSWLARAYLTNGQTNQAISAGRSAVKKSPKLISGYQILTEIFLQTGKTNEAITYLERASDQAGIDVAFLIKLGELHGDLVRTQTSTAAEQTKKRGLAVLRRAVKLKPANPNLRQKLADNFAQLGDIQNAADLYLQLLKEFSDMPLMRDALREKLTNLYLRNNDKSKASEQLEALVRDNPTRHPEAWYLLGTLANDAAEYEKAADYYNRALVVNPAMEAAYFDLAGVQINLNQPAEAVKTLETVREKFQNSFTAEFFTALAYSRMKNYSEALKHFNAAEIIGNATATNRLNHHFYFQVGATCERNGDYVGAAKYFEKSLEREPDFADALNYLGFMWADRGEQLEKARRLIERAVELEPDNAAFLDSLGWVMFKMNELEPGLKYLLRAAQLNEEPDAAIYDHIGDVYHALKQAEKAREAWRKSLAVEPSQEIEKKLQPRNAP